MKRQDIWIVPPLAHVNSIRLYGVVHVFEGVELDDEVFVCRSPFTQVWTGEEWVSCEGPAGNPRHRCPHCDNVAFVTRLDIGD